MLRDAKLITSIYNTFKPGSAVIAGGCLRDIDTGREPKDIDILIEWESQADYREAEILANRLGYGVYDCSESYGDNEDEQLRCVYQLAKHGQKDIDLIFLNCSVQERIANFSCNASMVWLDGNEPKCLPQYTRFIETKELEFFGTVTEEYKERLLSYYPQD